jgi:hypothetical protein
VGTWNLINRLIVPMAYSPGQNEDIFLDSTIDVANASFVEIATGSEFGLADITYSGYLNLRSCITMWCSGMESRI